MRAGSLRYLISIEAASIVRDSAGEAQKTWTSFADVWAAKKDRSGGEVLADGQLLAEAVTVFRIRWRGEITPTMRVVFGGVIHDIISLADVGYHDALDIVTRSRADL